MLRAKQIYHLGKVKRLYLEACGIFSVYQEEEPKPGLPLFPPDDKSLLEEKTSINAAVVCINCGTSNQMHSCKNYGNDEWTTAIV